MGGGRLSPLTAVVTRIVLLLLRLLLAGGDIILSIVVILQVSTSPYIYTETPRRGGGENPNIMINNDLNDIINFIWSVRQRKYLRLVRLETRVDYVVGR